MSPERERVLRYVINHSGVGMADIAKALGKSESATARMLANLRGHGLISVPCLGATGKWTAQPKNLRVAAVARPERVSSVFDAASWLTGGK